MPAPIPAGDLDDFGTAVRTARTARGMSQGGLAEAIGMGQSEVSALERGETVNVPAAVVVAIARALDLDAGDLVELAAKRARPDHANSET